MTAILEFISWIVCGAVVLAVALAAIGLCALWRDDR